VVSPHRQAQAESAEDAAGKKEHFDVGQHLSQSSRPVEGKYERIYVITFT